MLLRIQDGRAYGDGRGQGHRQEHGPIAVKRFDDMLEFFGGEVTRNLVDSAADIKYVRFKFSDLNGFSRH